ncbi:MAG TPA: DUF5674 family protein [Blastocatellia bacterium]|nr:DUF5674 family protein [Blastocatellia bacterium]
MIHLIRTKATPQQITEMLKANIIVIKTAVDVRRGILAGGGSAHSDCEEVLLNDGSQQEDIWGASWDPNSSRVILESFINIRPRQNNRLMLIEDPILGKRITDIIKQLLEDV